MYKWAGTLLYTNLNVFKKLANLISLDSVDVSLLLRWLGCACSKLLQLHFCCSLLLLDGICPWFTSTRSASPWCDSLFSAHCNCGSPTYCWSLNWPLIQVCWIPCHATWTKLGGGGEGDKASGCCLLHKVLWIAGPLLVKISNLLKYEDFGEGSTRIRIQL